MPFNVQDQDYILAVARGVVPGASIVRLQGFNGQLAATATKEDVWSYDGVIYELPTSQLVQIYSSSANDDTGGTGALTVKIFGLDANGALQSETLTMDGVTQVDSVGTYSSIYKMQTITAGSNASNFGTLYIRGKVNTSICLTMSGGAPGNNISDSYVYEVPTGYDALLLDAIVGYGYSAAPSNLGSNFFVRAKVPTAEGGSGLWEIADVITTPTGASVHKKYSVPIKFPARTRMKMSANSGTANLTVFASSDLLLVAR